MHKFFVTFLQGYGYFVVPRCVNIARGEVKSCFNSIDAIIDVKFLGKVVMKPKCELSLGKVMTLEDDSRKIEFTKVGFLRSATSLVRYTNIQMKTTAMKPVNVKPINEYDLREPLRFIDGYVPKRSILLSIGDGMSERFKFIS